MTVSMEHGYPVLRWPNTSGQAYLLQTASDLGTTSWETKAILTTDATEVVWADEGLPRQAVFYRAVMSTNPAPFQSLQRALQKARVNQNITGASAAAVLPQRALWLGTSGRSHGTVPIRPQTRFEIGSVTKTFVAVTVLRLVEEGRLGLDDPISKWLPTLNQPNISSSITVRQLLNHRAGTYNFGDDVEFRQVLFADWSRYWQPEQVLAYVKAPYFEPDTDGQYSNTGYVLLGMIIRSVTGSTVAAELRRAVLDLAGLRSTCLGGEEPWTGDLAHLHLDFNGDGTHEDLVGYSPTAILSSFWTSGAVISTASDVARFGIALFEDGLLTANALTQMHTFQPVDVAGADYDYGLGLMRFDVLGREHWAHSGGLFGHYAWLSYCPSTGVSLGITYNYPQTKATGASLPSELLIALAALPEGGFGARVSAPLGPLSEAQALRFPFLDPAMPP